MPCYRPLQGYRAREVNASGKRSLVFGPEGGKYGFPVEVPCGRCIGCRLERSRQWAIRLVHEGALHEEKCFLTLTYDPAHLPPDGSLDVTEFQRFMKRLRKKVSPTRIRFFHCGEYGEKLGRPHYHACLFNFDFLDKSLWSVREGVSLYVSPILAELWPFGFSTIGDVTFESAAYVARYVMKKVTGAAAPVHYEKKKPEYVTMSRRPGIGKGWYDKFKSDVYPHDFVVVNGVKVRPPKFYDSKFELTDPQMFSTLKARRVSRSTVKEESFNDVLGKMQVIDANCDARLAVKEEVLKSRINQLVRPLEGSNA